MSLGGTGDRFWEYYRLKKLEVCRYCKGHCENLLIEGETDDLKIECACQDSLDDYLNITEDLDFYRTSWHPTLRKCREEWNNIMDEEGSRC